MKIYAVEPDLVNYQEFFYHDRKSLTPQELLYDCFSKLQDWRPPELYVLYPRKKVGNFYALDSSGGKFCLDEVAAEILRDQLEMSGELLPVTYEGKQFYIINVLECINILDQKKTEWRKSEDGTKLWIERYAFHRNRITEVPLFKIPEGSRATIFTFEGLKDPEDEFKYVVESNKLEGLKFVEVWDSKQ